MPEYKSRINIKIEKICDWDKLLDIKIKEEWKLDKSAEDIFREAYYRGGFIKAGDWSVDPESLEDMVEYFAKTIGHENCVIMADVLEQNAENPSCNSFLALGNQNIVCVSYLNCDKLNGTNIFDIYEYLKQIDFELSPMDSYYLKQYSEDFIYFDTNGIEVVIPKGRNEIIAQEFAGDISVERVVIPDGVISIGERAFEDCPMLNEVVIPNSVTSIEYGAFNECSSLTDVYYTGTKAEWEKIDIDNSYNGNDDLLNATIHYSDIAPSTIYSADKVSTQITSGKLKITLNVDDNINNATVYVAFRNKGKIVDVKKSTLSNLKAEVSLSNKTYTDIDIYIWNDRQQPYTYVKRV